MALIKCSKCGNMVSDKASSCPKCGTPIINNKSYCKNADTNNDKLKIEEPLKNKRTNTTSFIGRHFFLYAALIVVLVVGFIGTWSFFNNDNSSISTGLIAATHRYDEIREFHEGMAAVCKNGMWGYIDKQGKECIPCIYNYVDEGLGGEPLRNFHEGLVAVCENDKWGFIDKKGKQVIPCKYGLVEDSSEGLAFAKNGDNGFVGYIDRLGNQVISCEEYNLCGSFCDGFATVYNVHQNRHGYIDKKGREIVPLKYSNAIPFSEGLAAVKIDIYSDEWTIIDTKGNPIFSYQCDEIKSCSNGMFAVGTYSGTNDILWGFIDKTGREVVPLKYYTYWNEGNEIEDFSNGFVRVWSENNSCCKFLDTKGNIRFEEYEAMGPFSDGMAAVSRDGKLGFIDVTGKEIIPCKYTPINNTYFSDGLAVISLYGQIGFVDKYGKDTIGDVN